MKRILLAMYYMECGGVENAIIELIKRIPQDAYMVDLLLLEKKGEFLNKIPEWVNIIELKVDDVQKTLIESLSIRQAVRFGLQRKEYSKTIKLFFKYFKEKIAHDPAPAYKTVFGKKKLYMYDLALDFHGYCSLTTYLLSENVVAEKKYTWVHSEPIAEKLGEFEKYLQKYNNIFCVSKKCASKARKALSESIRTKVGIFYNFFDMDSVLKKSEDGKKLPRNTDEISILTVGRLSIPKGYDMAIDVAKKLKDFGLKYKWYFCGDGEEVENIKHQIAIHDLHDCIVMLGFQDNPYGYMKSCDIYVQCSRYEGYAVTLVEAAVIGCPIITTDVSGAREEITDGENGYVVNYDVVELSDAIIYLASNDQLRNSMKQRKANESITIKKSQNMLDLVLE